VFCERDLRLRAVFDALQGERALLAGMVRRASETGQKDLSADNLLSALRTTHGRSRGESFGPYEGVFSNEAVIAKLAERFGPTRCWSPSQLEAYAYCPYRFFSERVMRLEPLGDLALEVDHAMRGQILHGALTHLHRQLNDWHKSPSSPAIQSSAEFEEAAAEVLDMLLETITTDAPIGQALREVDRRLLTQWLRNYYGQHQQYDDLWQDLESPLRPTYFEVSFGPKSDSFEDEEDVPVASDALTTTKPLQLERDGDTLSFRGRVDRVDLGMVAGQKVFNVVDYKSGSKYKFSLASISTGETIQLPLYALAVEQLLLVDQGAIPWQASYWLIKEKGFNNRSALAFHQLVNGEIVADEKWSAVKDELLNRIFGLVRGIRQGAFPMFSPDEHCTSRCDFRTVCRVAQTRSLEKTWQPPGESE
jgi:ATP-dependent helicase/nuclease subunit B